MIVNYKSAQSLMSDASASLTDLNERSREIFRTLVETYLATGEPVGSRTLSKRLPTPLSPATIRNVMQDLEHLGVLDSPHVSAGRRPTHMGLRMFVDGMLEMGDVAEAEKLAIDQGLGQGLGDDGASVGDLLDQAGALLSGLSQAASLVVAPKEDAPVKHIDFIALSEAQTLVVLVKEDGGIENRLIEAPMGLTPSAMNEAANFLNAQMRGRTLDEARTLTAAQIAARRQELGDIASRLVEAGVAVWSADREEDGIAPERLIVRGRANLLTDEELSGDVERMRSLFEDLDRKRDIAQLIDLASGGEGVRIFIGSENKLFSLAGSSLIISPYMNADRKIVGAIGVIGPTRMNYGRIVPIVDYTATLMGRAVADRGSSGG